MKDKMTFHQIYEKLKELRELRDMYARIVADYLAEEGEEAKHITKKYKHINEVIEYYSAIEVEFENKYKTEEE